MYQTCNEVEALDIKGFCQILNSAWTVAMKSIPQSTEDIIQQNCLAWLSQNKYNFR